MPAAANTSKQYIESLAEDRRDAIATLDKLIRKAAPKLKRCLMHRMLGYGPYRYRYASGREGDTAVIALAAQKNYISLYICACDENGYLAERYRDRLPKANIGKSCVRFKRLEDVDLRAIERMVKDAAKLGGMSAASQ